MGKSIQGVTDDLLGLFEKYNWPGNIRELEHTIEHAMNMAEIDDSLLCLRHLPPFMCDKLVSTPFKTYPHKISDNHNLKDTMNAIEKGIITQCLENNQYNISRSARQLGISRQHLQYRMKVLNIEQ
ncbi:MAG: helix-turn-helix domain-containing protein [Bacillota bacterium]